MKNSIKILIGLMIWISTSAFCFSKSTLEKDYDLKIIVDTNGTKFIAFDSTELNYLIKDLKRVGWNKKQLKSLEKQILNLKWINYKQKKLNDTLNNQIESYIEIKFNLDKKVELQQKSIESLEKNIEDLEIKSSNKDIILKETEEKYKAKIKKKNKKIALLVTSNLVSVALLLMSIL